MDILSFDKVIYHFDRLQKMQTGEPQFPVHLTISLGNLCNHRCLWCSVYAQLQKDVQLTDVDKLLAFLEKGAARNTCSALSMKWASSRGCLPMASCSTG